jgi:nucleoside-diphosphate-sugar epimerase
MRIFVAGATGAVGKRLVPLLVAIGHEVSGTTRSADKASLLRAGGAEPVVVDALDRDAVMAAVRNASPEVVVHQLTALPGLPGRNFDQAFALTNRLRTEGLDYLLDGARAAGARRVIAQSYAGWPYAREGGPVKTEEDPLDPHPRASMRETLAAIHHVEDTVTAADGLVLRYGALYGPGTSLSASGEITEMVRKRRFPIVGKGTGVWSFAHIDDVAGATLAAIERGAPGVYNVVDDEPAPVAQWLPDLASVLGAKPPRRVPVWLGRLAAGEAVVGAMTDVRGAANAKAKRELGWQPAYASWRQGFRTGLSA